MDGGKVYPKESGIIPPVPCSGVQHIRRQNAADDADNDTRSWSAGFAYWIASGRVLLKCPAQDNRLDL